MVFIVSGNKKLTVTGDGNLTVTGSNVSEPSYGSNGKNLTLGIIAGTLEMNGTGTVTATGGASTQINGMSEGILLQSGDLTANSGILNANGGNARQSTGIVCAGTATVNAGATVNATGVELTMDVGMSGGLNCAGIKIQGGTLTATGGDVTGNTADANGTTLYPSSCGIYASTSIEVTAGSISGTGGAATNGNSYGIKNNGTFTISGGTTKALGATAALCGQNQPDFGTVKWYKWRISDSGAYTQSSVQDCTLSTSSPFETYVEIAPDDAPAPPPAGTSHTVTILPCANGGATADKATAKQGDTVTVTPNPSSGYKLKSIKVLDGLGQDLSQEIGLVITNNSFSMPDMNVKIQVEFEKINNDGFTDELTATSGNTNGSIKFTNKIPDDCILDIRTATVPENLKQSGISSVLFEITVMQNNSLYPITGNQMTITIILPENLTGKDIYFVTYLNDAGVLSEKQTATVNGNILTFTTNHLSGYLVEAHTHNFVWVTDKATTATVSGLKHEECTICGEKRNENTVIAAVGENHTHTLAHVAAKAATATTTGNKEYWYCSECGKYFSDAAGKNEITLASTVIAARGTNSNTTSPQTGDNSNMTLWIALLFVSGGAATALGMSKKRKKANSK